MLYAFINHVCLYFSTAAHGHCIHVTFNDNFDFGKEIRILVGRGGREKEKNQVCINVILVYVYVCLFILTRVQEMGNTASVV